MPHPYCTQNGSDPGDIMPARISSDQLQRLTAETDTDPIDQSVIDNAIEDADNLIDGYCAMKYNTPFVAVPGRVKTGSAKIAAYNLFEKQSSSVGMPDSIRKSFEDEIAFFKDVSKGVASLGIDPPPANNTLVNAKIQGNPRTFTKDKLIGF